jgi:DHA1 family inner membrane transport protein
MTVPGDSSTGRRRGVVLAGLLLGTFVTGTAELLTAGLLPLISPAFGVSVAAAGSLFSAYALGLAIGGPLLTAATIRLDRRPVLVGTMALFAAMVLAPAVVPHFGWFVATRLMAGALQGLFLAAAFTTATAVVPRERVGRALAVVIAGFSISTVLGLPLGVLVGSAIGWRGALLMVGGFAVLATGLLVSVVPTVPGSRLSGASGLRHALAPRLLAMLALSLTLFAAPGAVMGYLMPLLQHITGVAGPLVSAILVAYGVANVVGSFLGGRLADANAARALIFVTFGLVTSAAALFVARSQPLLAVAAILAWALFASSAPASIQYRTVSLAGPAGALVASLPASAASAGIALGSTASGIAYTAAGPSAVIITGMIIALGALALAIATRRLQRPADEPAGAAATSVGAAGGDDGTDRAEQDAGIQLGRPGVDVVQVKGDRGGGVKIGSAADLPQSGHARCGVQTALRLGRHPSDLGGQVRAGADQRHRPAQHVEQLR